MSDKCGHNDHDHALIWIILFIIGTGGCPSVVNNSRFKDLEKRIQNLEQAQNVKAEEVK